MQNCSKATTCMYLVNHPLHSTVFHGLTNFEANWYGTCHRILLYSTLILTRRAICTLSLLGVCTTCVATCAFWLASTKTGFEYFVFICCYAVPGCKLSYCKPIYEIAFIPNFFVYKSFAWKLPKVKLFQNRRRM